MVNCCVLSCKSDSKKQTKILNDIGFHRFPKNTQRIELWEEAISRPGWNANIYSRICTRHFKEDCFYVAPGGARKLKDQAMPTEFLNEVPHDGSHLLLPSTVKKSPDRDPDLTYDVTDEPRVKHLKRRLICATEISERRKRKNIILAQAKRRLLRKIKIFKQLLKDLEKKPS